VKMTTTFSDYAFTIFFMFVVTWQRDARL